MKKIKAGDYTITIGKPNYFFSKYEEKIKHGDIIGYALTPQTKMSSPKNIEGGTVSLITEIHQPILKTGILISVIDDKRIHVLEGDGHISVLDRTYFSDIVLLHKKDSEDALLYCHALCEEMCLSMSVAGLTYRANLLCNISKKFAKEYLTTMEK